MKHTGAGACSLGKDGCECGPMADVRTQNSARAGQLDGATDTPNRGAMSVIDDWNPVRLDTRQIYREWSLALRNPPHATRSYSSRSTFLPQREHSTSACNPLPFGRH